MQRTRRAVQVVWRFAAVSAGATAVLWMLAAAPSRADSGRPTGWSAGPSAPAGFTGRWDPSYAYFDPTGSVVLFGGSPKDYKHSFYNDTWIYRAGAWQQGPGAPSGLAPRGGATMAYDPDIGRIVLFGGQGSVWPPYNDTWLFDGAAWARGPATPAGLAGRTGAQMVYDPLIHAVVLFGGSGLIPYTDTWLFNGTSWTPGPPAPAAMQPRVFFGMTFDAGLGKVVVAGGDGGQDVWYFDGTAWTPAPSLAAGEPKERFRLAYDPQLGGDVYVSGLGPGQADVSAWILTNGAWTQLQNYNAGPWPMDRIDGAVLWNPSEDSLMLFDGIADDFNGGETARVDTWFLREVPPTVASVSLSPTSPSIGDPITATTGAPSGGWGNVTYQWAWFDNGVVIPGQTTPRLPVGNYVQGDVIQAEVRATDAAGYSGPWVISASGIVVDRPPSIGSVSISPASPYVSSTITAVTYRVSDPDGDPVTLHFTWAVNGVPLAGNDASSISGVFNAGDSVQVSVTPVDSLGMDGASVSSSPVTVRWNIASGTGVPGGTIYQVSGGGYGPGELVNITLDSAAASPLTAATADSSGSFWTSVTLPNPLAGGAHMLWGIGGTSGIVGEGPLTVLPTGSLTARSVAAGDTTAFNGAGYQPGETVSVSFPGGPVVEQQADANGSVSASLVSPPEPAGGGVVTAAAPSASTTVPFTVVPKLSLPSTGQPGAAVALTATGFASGETVNAAFDAGPVIQLFVADASGSVAGTLPLAITWGKHLATLSGTASSSIAVASITANASMTLSPNSARVGETVQVTSGPGWVPGSLVRLSWGSTLIATVTADANGVVSTTFVVPAHAPGSVRMNLMDSVLMAKATTTFTVTS